MSSNGPALITDESKFQEKTVNGIILKYAQHEDNKERYTIKTDGIGIVCRLQDGATLEDALEKAAVFFKQQLLLQKMMAALFIPQLAPVASEETGPASPGTSRFGFGFSGNANSSPRLPVPDTDSDNEFSRSPSPGGF